MDEPSQPTIYILAGPNGAGKTTFANSFLPTFANCREFLNADLIAAGLAPFAPETQAVRASELLLAGSGNWLRLALHSRLRRHWRRGATILP